MAGQTQHDWRHEVLRATLQLAEDTLTFGSASLPSAEAIDRRHLRQLPTLKNPFGCKQVRKCYENSTAARTSRLNLGTQGHKGDYSNTIPSVLLAGQICSRFRLLHPYGSSRPISRHGSAPRPVFLRSTGFRPFCLSDHAHLTKYLSNTLFTHIDTIVVLVACLISQAIYKRIA